jgi:peptidoglycan/LPS O-acetylase OafA/YrhL
LTIGLDTTSDFQWMINGIYTSLFCGPAAVIVFFLISGFCIHFPYRDSWSNNTALPFLIARLTRISLPILLASLFIRMIGFNTSVFYLFVGWSIVCEIAYYALYPLLRSLIRTNKGWVLFLLVSYFPTFLAFFLYPLDLVNYPGVGFFYVTALGLPCWVLGVLLCHSFDREVKPPSISVQNLFFYRALIIFCGFLTHVLALQEILGHPFTLNFFAVAVFFWLRKEIAYYWHNLPNKILERLGRASYSIYLMHGIPPFLIGLLDSDFNRFSRFLLYWLLLISLTALFYVLVEKPSHKLSRSLFKQLLPKTTPC